MPFRTFGSLMALTLSLLLPAARARAEEPAEPEAPKEAQVVQLTIKGSFEEALPEANPFGPSPLHFKGLLEIIKKAKEDQRVAAIVLKPASPNMGLAQARELVEALRDFRGAGKKIHAFAETAGTVDFVLLSAADRVTMPESAMVILPGVSIESLYMKGLFDRAGVRFLVAHIGDYKSAFENFSLESMSPACREAFESLVDSSYRSIQEIIARGRRIAPEKVAEAIDRGFLSSGELKDLGLIDEVAYEEHFWNDVKADLGVEKLKILTSYGRKSIEIDTQNPFAVFRLLMEAFSPPARRVSRAPKIAIVYANGAITSGKSRASPFGGSVSVGSDTLVEAIRSAAGDATVKAIVLRISSPGGSGLASDAIWEALREARKKKPLVASMSDMAASGGYYIAMGADRILAQPDTLTGSIGVVSALVNVRGTMDLLGIRVERVSRGKGAGIFSPFSDPAEVSIEPLRKYMESFYWQFVDKAAAGRKTTREAIHAVAQGRVWTGRDALERGLVDELGGLDRAIEVARELASVPAGDKLETMELPSPPNVLESISEAFGVARASPLPALLGAAGGSPEAFLALPAVRDVLARAAVLLRAAEEGPILMTPVDLRIR